MQQLHLPAIETAAASEENPRPQPNDRRCCLANPMKFGPFRWTVYVAVAMAALLLVSHFIRWDGDSSSDFGDRSGIRFGMTSQ